MYFVVLETSFDQNCKWNSVDFAHLPIKTQISPSQLSNCQREALLQNNRDIPTATRLVSSCDPSQWADWVENILFVAVFYAMKITKIHTIVRCRGYKVFRDYIQTLNEARAKEQSSIANRIFKSLSNSLCGKLHQSIEKTLKSVPITTPEKYEKILRDDQFFDMFRLGDHSAIALLDGQVILQSK